MRAIRMGIIMTKYFLAIDIGASSGRHILGYIRDGKIITEEIYRFENKIITLNGQLCWDIENLRDQVLCGMRKCKEIEKIPESIAIDTWAVDYVLLDRNDKVIGNAVSYRDRRTEDIQTEITKYIDKKELYSRTGLNSQNLNTIGQLLAQKINAPQQLCEARTFLMIPDYLNYCLTGKKANEYTNASTTQLVHCKSREWDCELISNLGLPQNIFLPLSKAGDKLGYLSKSVSDYVGYSSVVVLCASHDTASAVVAVPLSKDKNEIYLSSGTWSIMGIEQQNPNCGSQSMKMNFSNEGGYANSYRYLKNIPGLWFIQSIKRELGNKYSYNELSGMAEVTGDSKSRIDINHKDFLSPDSMIEAIKKHLTNSCISLPKLMSTIYHSLSEYYALTFHQIEELTESGYDKIIVIGGGSRDDYLNRLTAQKCKKEVVRGPAEATAVGNIAVQMLTAGEVSSLDEIRQIIKISEGI